MADDLPTTIIEAAGQAATVRVGTVTSVTPLAISLNGTPLNMAAVGVIGGGFAVGGPVVLLGQSVEGAGTSGSTWCALGTPFPAGVPQRRALTQLSTVTASGGVGPVPNTATAVPGCQIVFPVVATRALYEASIVCDMGSSGSNTILVGELNVDGLVHPQQALAQTNVAAPGTRVTAGQQFSGVLFPGSHTFTLTVRSAGAVAGAVSATHTTLRVALYE